MEKTLLSEIYTRILSLVFIPNWIISKDSKTILDAACGQGLPMKMINFWYDLESVGVDLYKPYINQCKNENIHNRYLIKDISKLDFSKDSFDVVMALQVLEHLPKRKAFSTLKNLEKIAKKQIIISTPYGKSDYHTDDGNRHQEHKSYFLPEEFEKLGYKIIRMGGKRLYSEDGLAKRIKYPLLRKLVIAMDIFLTPFYILFQKRADYYFFAYKNFE